MHFFQTDLGLVIALKKCHKELSTEWAKGARIDFECKFKLFEFWNATRAGHMN